MRSSTVRRQHLALVLILAGLAACPLPAKAQPATQPVFAPGMVGENVSGLRDYSRNQVFADCLRTAKWRTFDDKADALLDAQGNPATDVSCWAFLKGTPADSNGDYAFRCRGQVLKITMSASAAKVTAGPAFDGTFTTATIKVDKSDGQAQLHLFFQTAGGKGFTEPRLLRPGIDTTAPPVFNPRYVAYLRTLNPALLRGMEWGRTNGNKTAGWSERPSEFGYQGDGASPELFIDLCNEIGAHAWVNVPHLWDDASVESYARMVKARLRKDRYVYVEYSNEWWNDAVGKDPVSGELTGFTQWAWGKEQARKAVAAGDTRFDASPTSDFTRTVQWGAMRATQVADVWVRVFDETGERDRIRPVLGGHSNNEATLRIKAAWVTKWLGPVKDHFYGLTVAPYFGAADKTRADYTADSFLAPDASGSCLLLQQALGVLQGRKMQDFFALCKAEGVVPLAYEGGLGFQPKKSPQVTAQVRTDDRLAPVYAAYLDEWFRQGGGVFCQFVECSPWDGDSAYGMNDSLARPPPAAARALAEVSSRHPHPLAPQPDPRDQRIKELQKQLTLSEQENSLLRDDATRMTVDRAKARQQALDLAETLK